MGRYCGSQQKKLKKIRAIRVRKQANRCYYCQKLFGAGSHHTHCGFPTIDHVVPHSKGGKISLDNVVASCQSCNNDKADLTLDEYLIKLNKRKEELNV